LTCLPGTMTTGDGLRFLLDIVQSLAQRGNMDAKIGLLDERIRPDMPDDFRIGLQVSRMCGEENEDIGRPAAQRHGPAIAQKRAAGRREREQSELQVAHKVILIQAPGRRSRPCWIAFLVSPQPSPASSNWRIL